MDFDPFKFRIGKGYDVHRLVMVRKLILGGVDIPYERGLLGHSDADVLTHAVMDSLLGAACCGDIGRHFPDTQESNRGISSLVLLEKVNKLIREKGYKIVNLDATIIAQKPKLTPFVEEMRDNLGRILCVDRECINIKCTTTEGMGFTGRVEGMAAECVCLLYKNGSE